MSAPLPRSDSPVPAFRAVYDAHVRFVWRALLRLGVQGCDLPDAVQDVFVVVHRKLPEFEQRSKMTTWLFAICARVASDRRQRAHARRELPTSDLAASAVDGSSGADALVELRWARATLEGIVGRMPDEQRTVFLLFELEGMSGDAIAELLSVPVGTVRSRLRLARAAFDKAVARQRASDPASLGALWVREA